MPMGMPMMGMPMMGMMGMPMNPMMGMPMNPMMGMGMNAGVGMNPGIAGQSMHGTYRETTDIAPLRYLSAALAASRPLSPSEEVAEASPLPRRPVAAAWTRSRSQ